MSDLKTVLPQLRFNADGLIPVIAQDATTKEVLMLAWMNTEALQQTVATGRATYWSRSRGELWRKGDTSGHQQFVQDISYDCDGDTILLAVKQLGAACHNGTRSCFETGKIAVPAAAPVTAEFENSEQVSGQLTAADRQAAGDGTQEGAEND